eukprot:1951569-Rhodomonas_salina.1
MQHRRGTGVQCRRVVQDALDETAEEGGREGEGEGGRDDQVSYAVSGTAIAYAAIGLCEVQY